MATRPLVDCDQEVRFAVVMYGGSSLAIYINGVAQELLRLVRATAPESGGTGTGVPAHLADEELRGSERVYRRLGRILGRHGPAENVDESNVDAPIRTRFVVDILTGTSAGGINAVYLAKALANDQDMDKLKNLWVTEGDIGVLINDAASYKDYLFHLTDDPHEPWSVLNSRRMYFALLQALRGMDLDKPACAEGKSPLVDELDLYVTATDMFGRSLDMRLADDVVSEYRHRNVFQFRYRSQRASDIDRSDFGPEYNAFLAFVARATSAHQAAFAPVRLGDVGPITEIYSQTYPAGPEFLPDNEKLREFYREYLLKRATSSKDEAGDNDSESLARNFQRVWFVDGGTLDNKPFSFVVQELPLRHADTFVDRKLLYIEPSPEDTEWRSAPEQRPRIVANAWAGLSSLPRYETIVEDLMRLLERNRLVERVGTLMREMESDLVFMPPEPPLTRDKFLELLKDREALKKWLESKGPSWGSYQRLRAAEVTDDMALLITRAAGFRDDSEEFVAIRYLVQAWRANRYDSGIESGKAPILQFLVEFDLLWAMRRVRFILKKLNDLAALDEEAKRLADVAYAQKKSYEWPAREDEAEFRKSVAHLRTQLNGAYVYLRGKRRALWASGGTNPAHQFIRTLDLHSNDLLELIHEPNDDARGEKAKDLLSGRLGDAVEELTKTVRDEFGEVINEVRHQLSKALRPPTGDAAAAMPRWDLFLRETLWYYYAHFDSFDQIAYPLLYSTGVGEEADVIDVFRVSPQDAKALVNENEDAIPKPKDTGDGVSEVKVKKLAGTRLGNFGAFFEQTFRVNDIKWGRLDGAERVIAALLPANAELRERMTQQAHRAIVVEEMMFADPKAAANVAMQRVVWEALDHWDDVPRRNELLSKARGMFLEDSKFGKYLDTLAGGADPIRLFRDAFLKDYDVSRQFTQDATVKSVLRINRVLGGMARGYFLGTSQSLIQKWKRVIALWLGKRLLTFTEAAIQPHGPARRRQRVWIILSYLISLAILVVVSRPAYLLWHRAPGPALGSLTRLIVTIVLAGLPLMLTVAYHYGWIKLKKKLDTVLPHTGGD